MIAKSGYNRRLFSHTRLGEDEVKCLGSSKSASIVSETTKTTVLTVVSPQMAPRKASPGWYFESRLPRERIFTEVGDDDCEEL